VKFKRKQLELAREALELLQDHYSQDPKLKKDLERTSKLLTEVEEALTEKRLGKKK
jgi:hypothetical protein